MNIILVLLFFFNLSEGKEIALTFDDVPKGDSKHFSSHESTKELIQKLKKLNLPRALIFANPCKGKDIIPHLKKYTEAGHKIGNHTCSHPKLDDVGLESYSKDILQGDQLLQSVFNGQKFFRYPYLNEGKDVILRDKIRELLKQNQYRNGMVSIDNDDYIFSFKINEAIQAGKKINYKKVKNLFVKHIIGAVNFYDELAIQTLGYSPKHVLLLHEKDATVMFLDSLIKELRKQGWKIISVDDAYKDKIYLSQPKSIYANNGIIAQIHADKTGEQKGYFKIEELKSELDKILDL